MTGILQVYYLSILIIMIYLVHTIKELSNSTINTDFVIEAGNEIEIKELMSEYRVIVLWITKVNWWPNSGQFFWFFQTSQNKRFKFCLKAESLESVCTRCVDLELPLISINDIKNPISEEQTTIIIKQTREKKQAFITEQKSLEEKEKQKKKSIMDDKRKEKIMSVIWDTINDITTIENNAEAKWIPWDKRKKLREFKELLTKIKMWSNLEKATNVLEEAFILMESIETQNLFQMKEEEQKVINSSVISNIDIVGELEKLKRANQTNEAGTKKRSSDLYYTYLWIAWLYQKFILKDIINKFLEFKTILTYTIQYIALGIMVISVSIWWILLYHLLNNTLNQNLLLSMMTIGIIGLIREIPLAIKKASFVMSMLYIILAIVTSIIIQKLLVINFALI